MGVAFGRWADFDDLEERGAFGAAHHARYASCVVGEWRWLSDVELDN